ncbi:hypothetical protein F4678DRAFT_232330 [Xylaria arbuscula]|nr:hypothetical protein F4678DRAFT_232330 [Xylaria arbuscula]
MANTIRGDGLFQAHDALAALLDNPHRLDLARDRFDDSPPSYRSRESGTPTRSPSPDRRSERERRREKRVCELIREYNASQPLDQFDAQMSEMRNQILYDDEEDIRRAPVGVDYDELAFKETKKRWIEQGIWNEKWAGNRLTMVWTWKHEELPTPEPQEDEAPFSIFSSKRKQKQKEPEPEIDPQVQAAREREREASRPYHQFVYQVSKRRERIQELLSHEGAAITTPPDINTTAYDVVKATWMKKGIWNTKWGMFPGMSWRHEQPVEVMLREEIGDDYRYQPYHSQLARNKVVQAPLPPVRNPIFGEPSRQVAAAPDIAQNSRRGSAGPVEMPNGNIDPAPVSPVRNQSPMSAEPRFGEPSRQVAAAPDIAQNSRRGSAGPVEIPDGNADPAPSIPSSQPAPEVNGNVAPKQKRAPRRKRLNQEVEQAPVPPRRSKRLQEAASKESNPTRASKRQRVK